MTMQNRNMKKVLRSLSKGGEVMPEEFIEDMAKWIAMKIQVILVMRNKKERRYENDNIKKCSNNTFNIA